MSAARANVEWKGKIYTTGIFKSPVEGRIALRSLNLAGDQQVDLSVHGGPDRAVYVYPGEHYEFWKRELARPDLPWGSFGENLTSWGLLEDAIHIGDRIRFGSAVLTATQPRMPCVKLGIRLNDAGVVKRFYDTDRSGFYTAVLEEGEVGAGDDIEILSRDPRAMTVIELRQIYLAKGDAAAIRRVLEFPPSPPTVLAIPTNARRHREAGPLAGLSNEIPPLTVFGLCRKLLGLGWLRQARGSESFAAVSTPA